jgi:hypothetical protein
LCWQLALGRKRKATEYQNRDLQTGENNLKKKKRKKKKKKKNDKEEEKKRRRNHSLVAEVIGIIVKGKPSLPCVSFHFLIYYLYVFKGLQIHCFVTLK